MSAILKALRKLESDLSKPGEIRRWPFRGGLEPAGNRRNTVRRLYRTLVVLFVGFVLAAVAGGYVYFWSPEWIESLFPEAPSDNSVKKTGPKQTAPVRKTMQRPSATDTSTKKAAPPITRSRTPKGPSQMVTTAKPGLSGTPSRRESTASQAVSAAPNPKTAAPVQTRPPIPKPVSPPARAAARSSSGSAPMASGTSTNSGLTLQAIAWSDNPAERIAVINSRILREGDSIGEASVAQIGENEVIVREGSTLRKLLFKLKSK